MAFATLLTLLDDVASMLDDVALMTKMAAKKTAGVVGDDLALNANQVTGAAAERELPIVVAVAKGSLVNKLILIPLALLLAVARICVSKAWRNCCTNGCTGTNGTRRTRWWPIR